MDIKNNKYEDAKLLSWLELLMEASRLGKSLGESSDSAKKAVGRNYAEYSKKVDDGIRKKAETAEKKETQKKETPEYAKPDMASCVSSISVDWGTGVVKLKFKDGRVTSAKCHPDDDFDLTVGISLCFARWVFGDLSKAVENLLGF